MSEVAQLILQNRAAAHNWPLSSYPGKIQLPKDGFHNLKSHPEALANHRRSYLSEEAQTWLKSAGKKSGAVAGPSVSILLTSKIVT
jgi:sister-chromatid-cohesion protein PDS5